MSARATHMAALAGLALAASGCATLDGNVRGDFACRAPAGSCAPTTAIDTAATRGAAATTPAATTPPARSAATANRTLRIVIAAQRDTAGRDHEARVVHVALPEPAAAGWRAPADANAVLRALGQAGTPASPPAQTPFPFPLQLPEVLVIPSQDAPELPGASAPDPGAPGRPPSPGRVPHLVLPQGDPR